MLEEEKEILARLLQDTPAPGKIKDLFLTNIWDFLALPRKKVRHSLLTALREYYAHNLHHLLLPSEILWAIAKTENTLETIWKKSLEQQCPEPKNPKPSSDGEITKKQELQIGRALSNLAVIYCKAPVMLDSVAIHCKTHITPDSEEITIILELFKQKKIPDSKFILKIIDIPQTYSEIPLGEQPFVNKELAKIFNPSGSGEKPLSLFSVFKEVYSDDATKKMVSDMLQKSRDIYYAKLSDMPQGTSPQEKQWEILLEYNAYILYNLYLSARWDYANTGNWDPTFFSDAGQSLKRSASSSEFTTREQTHLTIKQPSSSSDLTTLVDPTIIQEIKTPRGKTSPRG